MTQQVEQPLEEKIIKQVEVSAACAAPGSGARVPLAPLSSDHGPAVASSGLVLLLLPVLLMLLVLPVLLMLLMC